MASRIREALAENSEDNDIELWDAHFDFLPNRPRMAHIAIGFQQQMLHHGSFLKMPTLTVSALLSEESKVFGLIAKRGLEGLIKSFSLWEARLTDRDFDGRCLLNVSADYTTHRTSC